ncbi:hydroxymethylbilane synthase [Alkalibacter rhizosphaerae]|uniref:Porphobilinogen deaminase n=1 Tax=Alkalibacter rhizosphaerae TaxID=2815577 RepID=A0A975AIM5_9FIRM|nr:hydroxymethylbilane synthase [Alkalibacter rhizosphaerae]QSX08829.1 hydroxymethylbilane synthase [Alkalibacter rhizosphaerae]
MIIKVGSRGSNLAMTQTKWVMAEIKKHHPEVDCSLHIIKTTGDRIQDVSLDKLGEKGVFVKEIEEALLDGRIDLAVHSMKDMPGQTTPGLRFSAVPKREDPRDGLVLNFGRKSLEELPLGARVATGSKRRGAQLLIHRPDLQLEPIRGNVETRIRKMKEQGFDALVLAMAGLNRLGLAGDLEHVVLPLDVHLVIPSPAQGILGLQIRDEDYKLHEVLMCLEEKTARIQMEAERAFLVGTNGGCHIPMGAYCHLEGDRIRLEGVFGDVKGTYLNRMEMEGTAKDAKMVGLALAKQIKGGTA